MAGRKLQVWKFIHLSYDKASIKLSSFDAQQYQQGYVTDIVVIESTPKGIFEKVAVQALSKWKYEPLKDVELIAQKQKLVFKI